MPVKFGSSINSEYIIWIILRINLMIISFGSFYKRLLNLFTSRPKFHQLGGYSKFIYRQEVLETNNFI